MRASEGRACFPRSRDSTMNAGSRAVSAARHTCIGATSILENWRLYRGEAREAPREGEPQNERIDRGAEVEGGRAHEGRQDKGRSRGRGRRQPHDALAGPAGAGREVRRGKL